MRQIAHAFLVCVTGVTFAFGNTISFSTPVNSVESGGLPVSATATVTTDTDSLTITLSNLFSDPRSSAQTVTGFELWLDPIVNNANLTSVTGTMINIDPVTQNPIQTAGSITHWTLTPTLSDLNSILSLTSLGGSHPANSIIGPPGSNGAYNNANASIMGDQPLIYATAVFHLDAPGVTASTPVTSATFFFSSTPGNGVVGSPSVPEPGSLSLLITGVLSLAAANLKKSWRK